MLAMTWSIVDFPLPFGPKIAVNAWSLKIISFNPFIQFSLLNGVQDLIGNGLSFFLPFLNPGIRLGVIHHVIQKHITVNRRYITSF